METVAGITMAILTFLAFPAMGWQSLKALRHAEDFPHRREMLWGARYGGWVAALGIVGPYYAAAIWRQFGGSWLFTSVGLAFVVICVFGMLAQTVLYWQMAGTFYTLTLGARRLKQQPTDTATVLASLEEQRTGRTAKILRWLLAIGIVFWLVSIATFARPLDGALRALEWQDRVEEQLRAEFAGLPVERVSVSREWGDFTPGYPGLDDLTPLMFPREGSVFYEGLSEISIRMAEGSERSDAEEAVEAAQRVLSRRGLRDEWIITAYGTPGRPVEVTWRPD